MKSVQISYDLFVDLVLYHLNGEDDFDEDIRQGLEQKLDAMLNRQIYSKYKKQEYLDRRGVPESYRWLLPLGSGNRSVPRSCVWQTRQMN